MEAGLKDFAAGVEGLVDRLVSGDLGGEVAKHMDGFVSGFIRHFENNYSKFEAAVKQTFRLPRRVPPPRRVKVRGRPVRGCAGWCGGMRRWGIFA